MTDLLAKPAYHAGFDTVRTESGPIDLPVEGHLPEWLAGDLVRNGPAWYDVGDRTYRHWFDGQALLHQFTFGAGEVRYRNRYLDTPSLRSAQDGRIEYTEFATDPCRSIFARFFSHFSNGISPSANASVNVTVMGDNARFALTEVPLAVQFDPETLATLGIEGYDDSITGDVTTAHPHQDPTTGDLVNYVLRLGANSEYVVYRQRPGSMTREVVARIPDRTPGYMHSFGITEEYAILAIFPHVVNPLSFLVRNRPFIENYRWRPELGTRFVVVRLSDGMTRTYTAEPFFSFHHINAYADGNELVVDATSYPDSGIIDAFYLNRLRAGDPIPAGVPMRYRIDLTAGTVRSQRLAEDNLELPRINYGRHNGRRYRYAYGLGQQGNGFLEQIVKLDVDSGTTTTWHEPGCYAGEPVFVSAPGTTSEDGGVLLSVVLDSASGTSFLLVLDAESMRELARARVPHAVPFGFHGQFTRVSR